MINWEAVGAIGEIVGATAVVLTLFYLAAQVRHSSKLARNTAMQEVAHASLEAPLALATDESLGNALSRYNLNEEVTPGELTRLAAFTYASNRHFENIYSQYREGMLEEDLWKGFRSNLKALNRRRSSELFIPSYYSTEYVKLVEEIDQEIGQENQVDA